MEVGFHLYNFIFFQNHIVYPSEKLYKQKYELPLLIPSHTKTDCSYSTAPFYLCLKDMAVLGLDIHLQTTAKSRALGK